MARRGRGEDRDWRDDAGFGPRGEAHAPARRQRDERAGSGLDGLSRRLDDLAGRLERLNGASPRATRPFHDDDDLVPFERPGGRPREAAREDLTSIARSLERLMDDEPRAPRRGREPADMPRRTGAGRPGERGLRDGHREPARERGRDGLRGADRFDDLLSSLEGIDRKARAMARADDGLEHHAASQLGDTLQDAIAEISARQSALFAEDGAPRDGWSRAARMDAVREPAPREAPPRESASRRDERDGFDMRSQFERLSLKLDQIGSRHDDHDIEALLEEVRGLRQLVELRPERAMSERHLADLRALDLKLDDLASQRLDPRKVDLLAGEVAKLREIVLDRNVEGSLRSLESGYSHIVERLDQLRRAVDDDRPLNGLADRIAGLQDALAGVPQVEQIAGIERRISALAGKLDQIAAQGGRDLTGRVAEIERQLGEMKGLVARFDPNVVLKGLAHLARQIDDLKTMPANAGSPLIERRIDELALKLDQLDRTPMDAVIEAFNRKIAELSERIEDLGAQASTRPAALASLENAVRRIDDLLQRQPSPDRLNVLEAQLQAIVRDTDPHMLGTLQTVARRLDDTLARQPSAERMEAIEARLGQLADRAMDSTALTSLAQTVRRIDEALPTIAEFRAIEGRIGEIVERIERTPATAGEVTSRDVDALRDEIAQMRAEFRDRRKDGDVAHIEAQIRALALKLEESSRGEPDARLVDQLEAQMNRLVRQIDANAQRLDGIGKMEGALARIQEHLVDAREDAIAVARDAARQAVAELAERPGAAPGVDDGAVRLLQDDLKRLQVAAKTAESRTQDTLQLVRDTLETIVERMGAMEARAAAGVAMAAPVATAAPVAAAPPQMPAPPAPPQPAAPRAPAPTAAAAALQAAARAMAEPPATAPEPKAAESRLVEASPFLEKPLGPKPPLARGTGAPEDNRPLEPGSGKPDLTRRTGEPTLFTSSMPRAEGWNGPGEAPDVQGDRKADFIAAARRAAQAAAELSHEQPSAAAPSPVERLTQALASVRGGRKGAEKTPQREAAPAARNAGPLPPPLPQAPVAPQPMDRPFAGDGVDAGAPASGGRFGRLGALPRKQLFLVAGAILLALSVFALYPRGGDEPAPAAPVAEAPPEPAPMPQVVAQPQTPVDVPVAPQRAEAPVDTPQPAQMAAAPEPAPTHVAPVHAAPPAVAEPPAPVAAPQAVPASTGPVTAPLPPATIGSEGLRTAAASGEARAQFEVASRYTEGKGVKVDLAEAARWYDLSARQGFAPAQYRLGSFYEKGQGVPQSLETARQWYQRAAEGGNARAMHNLAVLMTQGGTDADLRAAAEWFRKAGEFGVRDSQYNLGIMYGRGYGVAKDLAASFKWFAVAAKSGDADAGLKRDEVAKALEAQDKNQLTQAQFAVQTWQAKTPDPAANDVATKWSRDPAGAVAEAGRPAGAPTKGQIQGLQMFLAQRGLFSGDVNGQMSPKLKDAIKAFQKQQGQPVTGEIDAKILEVASRPRQ